MHLRGFVRVGWHMDGWTFDRYMRLTWNERAILHEEISDIIERTDGARPKDER